MQLVSLFVAGLVSTIKRLLLGIVLIAFLMIAVAVSVWFVAYNKGYSDAENSSAELGTEK